MRGPRLQPVRIPAGPYRYTFPRSGSMPRICRSECDRCVAVHGERKPLLLLYCHAAGVIGRFEKTVMDCPDPRVLANFYCQVLGMRVNEDIDGWVVIVQSLVSASWLSSGSPNGSRPAGLIQRFPSSCISTFA
jgi:glyoxalase superfamily protein